MWLERIIEAKKTQSITTKAMAEKVKLPEDTIARILSGKTKDPRLETVMRLGSAVGLNAWEIFAETGTVVGDKNLAELQAELDAANVSLSSLRGEVDSLAKANAELATQNAELNSELKHARREIELLDEVILAYKNCFRPKSSI
jgi:transcriptional regulator with XRE-family HTH domain